MTDIWEHLSLYESRDLLSRFYKERCGRDLSAEKAYEIIAHLAQGHGFFTSAQQSSELVRPLLLYYGVYALSRGLILFLDTSLREFSLPSSHGIEASGWQNALSQGLDQLPDLPLKITGGTFKALSKVTSNVERFLVNSRSFFDDNRDQFGNPRRKPEGIESSQLPQSHLADHPYLSWSKPGTTMIEIPTVITVKMGLERVVDLRTIFVTTFGSSSPKYIKAELQVTYPKEMTWRFFGENPPIAEMGLEIQETESGFSDADHIRSAMGLLRTDWSNNTHISSIPHYFHLRASSVAELLAKRPPIKSDREGKTYLVQPLPNGLDLSSLSLLYLIVYSMGMLARYHPSKWLSLLNSSKGDFAFPLMKAAITLVEDHFPQLVLQELEASR